MVEYLSCEENSVGRIAGFSRSVVALTGSADQHCEQGFDEGDAFGHSEIVAQFKFASFLLKLKSGRVTQEDVTALKVWICMKYKFAEVRVCSIRAREGEMDERWRERRSTERMLEGGKEERGEGWD